MESSESSDVAEAAIRLLRAMWRGEVGDFSEVMDEVYDLEHALEENDDYSREEMRDTPWARGE